MTVARGWTWLNEDAEHDEDSVAEIEELVNRWNALATELENERFMRQSQIEEIGYVEGEEDDDEDSTRRRTARRIGRELKDAELHKLEEMLHERGARLMRPYEHWNEEEAYMQYMESDRYGE
jgi:hypothetical protein